MPWIRLSVSSSPSHLGPMKASTMAVRALWASGVVTARQSGMIMPPGNSTAGHPADSARKVGVIIMRALFAVPSELSAGAAGELRHILGEGLGRELQAFHHGQVGE